MDWLQFYDFLAPTNPYAALFFGVIFTIIVAIVVWFEKKEINGKSGACGKRE